MGDWVDISYIYSIIYTYLVYKPTNIRGVKYHLVPSRRFKKRQALHVFPTLQRSCVERNSVSFNSTISACEKAGEWQQALQIFQQMAGDPWSRLWR